MRPIETYLEEVKKKAGLKTDKELAVKLGVKPAAICQIKNGSNTPSEAHCKILAELAKEPYEKVLLLAQVSKASETSKSTWERILKTAIKAGMFTMGLCLFWLAAPTLSHASAPAYHSIISDHWILCQIGEGGNGFPLSLCFYYGIWQLPFPWRVSFAVGRPFYSVAF